MKREDAAWLEDHEKIQQFILMHPILLGWFRKMHIDPKTVIELGSMDDTLLDKTEIIRLSLLFKDAQIAYQCFFLKKDFYAYDQPIRPERGREYSLE